MLRIILLLFRTLFREPSRLACDLFVVPTATFRPLFCFVILSHDRRGIIQFNVTVHPTAAWIAQQIREAFPGDLGGAADRLRAGLFGDQSAPRAPPSSRAESPFSKINS